MLHESFRVSGIIGKLLVRVEQDRPACPIRLQDTEDRAKYSKTLHTPQACQRKMRAMILLFWGFAGVAETLVLQPSLNVSALQNGSVEVASWVTWGAPRWSSAGEEEEQKRVEEPGTWLNVTTSDRQETDSLLSKRRESDEHRIFEEDGNIPTEEQKGGNQVKENEERLNEKTTEAEKDNSTEEKHGHRKKFPQAENLYPSTTPAVVHQLQHNTSLAPLPSQNVQPSVLSLVSAGTQIPPSVTGVTPETAPLSFTEGGRLLGTNVSNPLTSGTRENANSSVAQIEVGNSRPHPEMKPEVSPTAVAAKAGPTAMSLPNTFRTKPQPGIPKTDITDHRVAKVKKKLLKKHKGKKTKALKKAKKVKKLEKDLTSTAPYFPYFKDHYCPPECACYGRVVQCSDKWLERIPYGIPYNSRYILLMNNYIDSIPLDLLSEYLSMEFLVLSNNRLADSSVEGAFEGTQTLKRLYLDRNLLQSVPADLPASLEELRLDGNNVSVMSDAAWGRCPGLLILSLSNNSLGAGSSTIPAGVLSPLANLRTLSLSQNQLTSVPLQLPLSLQELYLRGNLIQHFQAGVFLGKSELQVLDLSANKLTSKGLGKSALINATRLESLNLEGNFLKHVPRDLPRSLKTLNLEGNSISSIGKSAFHALPHLEHLGLARNKISRVVPGAFWVLPQLHQLDLSHNTLRQVPRRLPTWLVSVCLTHNKIQTVPRDAFCWTRHDKTPKSRLVRVQLENNLVDLGSLDSLAFSCLRGFQVVHFY